MTPFTVRDRAQLRSDLLEFGRRDSRLSGVAITGSAAADCEDRWSDIDLAFGVTSQADVGAVLSDFSDFMYTREALHHHDVRFGAWIYRVFFLPGGLQVDLAFVDQGQFRPLGPAFKLVIGDAKPLQVFPDPNPKEIIGLSWLHAIHARTSILRNKLWQADYMVGAVRNYTLTLACIRLGLPSAHGRGLDSLPEAVTAPLLASLVPRLHPDDLWRALGVILESFASEVKEVDPELGHRISTELAGLATRPPNSLTTEA